MRKRAQAYSRVRFSSIPRTLLTSKFIDARQGESKVRLPQWPSKRAKSARSQQSITNQGKERQSKMAFAQKNRIRVGKAIANRETFRHASMHAEWVTEGREPNWGHLSYHPETITEIRNLVKDRDLYVVYSYNTPIAYAWDKEVHVPNHRYSVTTSHHQTIAKLSTHYALYA